jgi:hypothetical protein
MYKELNTGQQLKKRKNVRRDRRKKDKYEDAIKTKREVDCMCGPSNQALVQKTRSSDTCLCFTGGAASNALCNSLEDEKERPNPGQKRFSRGSGVPESAEARCVARSVTSFVKLRCFMALQVPTAFEARALAAQEYKRRPIETC